MSAPTPEVVRVDPEQVDRHLASAQVAGLIERGYVPTIAYTEDAGQGDTRLVLIFSPAPPTIVDAWPREARVTSTALGLVLSASLAIQIVMLILMMSAA